MYSFCPHCGETLEQDQREGEMLVCAYCGKQIGMIPAKPAPVEVIQVIQPGAAQCPICKQVVALKQHAKTLVPHYAGQTRKVCAGSGKPGT